MKRYVYFTGVWGFFFVCLFVFFVVFFFGRGGGEGNGSALFGDTIMQNSIIVLRTDVCHIEGKRGEGGGGEVLSSFVTD